MLQFFSSYLVSLFLLPLLFCFTILVQSVPLQEAVVIATLITLIWSPSFRYVTDNAPEGYASLCQHKLLSRQGRAEGGARTFPPCQLEWRANKRKAKMALEGFCPDGGCRGIEVKEEGLREGGTLRHCSTRECEGRMRVISFIISDFGHMTVVLITMQRVMRRLKKTG